LSQNIFRLLKPIKLEGWGVQCIEMDEKFNWISRTQQICETCLNGERYSVQFHDTYVSKDRLLYTLLLVMM